MRTILLLAFLYFGSVLCDDLGVPKYGWRIEDIVFSNAFVDAMEEITQAAKSRNFPKADVIEWLLPERLTGSTRPYGFEVKEKEMDNAVLVSFSSESFTLVFKFLQTHVQISLFSFLKPGPVIKKVIIDYGELPSYPYP